MGNVLVNNIEKNPKNNQSGAYDIRFGDYSFPYFLCNDSSMEFLNPLFQMANVDIFIIVCDRTIEKLYGQKIGDAIRRNHYQCFILAIEDGEANKNLGALETMIEKALGLKVTRRSCIIGLGGGLCGNIAGLLSVLLFRGIRLVHIPTSLMAFLDSVLSLKQAINSVHGKNLIGAFHIPDMVIANIHFLETLPRDEIISGLCEIVKNALTIVPETIEYLTDIDGQENLSSLNYNYLIGLGIKAKLKVMEHDPFEKKEGLVLEYGHTIGHAIELVLKGQLNHGKAVGLGMICAAKISSLLGFITNKEVELHKKLLKGIGAPVRMPSDIPVESIMSILRFDNKRGYLGCDPNMVHLILLEKIGKPVLENGNILVAVPENLICCGINEIFS